MIKYPIVNNFIKINLDDGNVLTNTGLLQKVLLKLSVYELHIDMLKKCSNEFSMAYYQKGLYRIIDSYLQLIIPPK